MRSRADNSGIQKAALQFTARDHFCEHHTQRRLPPNMDFSYKLLHKRTHWSLVHLIGRAWLRAATKTARALL